MTWFTIFTTLLAVQFTVGISDVVKISEVGSYVELQKQDYNEGDSCELETNTGQKYQFKFRSSSVITDRITSLRYGYGCGVRIDVHLEDAGEWKITTFFTTRDLPPVTQKFKLFIRQIVKVVPDTISITEGYFAYAELDMDKKNVTNCTLDLHGDYSYRIMQIDLLNGHTENFQRFGHCGFQMLANSSINEYYRQSILTAIVEDRFIYTGDVNIDVHSKTKEPESMQVVTLSRGERGKVSLSTESRTRFCQLEGPMGLKTTFYTFCDYDIPVVTSRHDGVWIARYGIQENPVPIIRRFRVVVRDKSSVDTNVTVTENNEIQLTCHVYDETGLRYQFCHFTRPDGYVLNLAPGIGTKSYSAFNVTKSGQFTTRSNVYCGLRIHQPKHYDYGAWKCGIGAQYKFYDGSIIYVDPSIINAHETREKEIEVVAENVYVKRNDSFQIKCTADATLSYCWFQGPNGTSFSVSTMQRQSPTTLPYVGLGLNFGECVVQVDHATYTDHGEWTCNVGITDGPEKSQKFFVNVTESYIIPEHSVLVANYEDITLSCNILPNLTNKEVRYCRWIHPDGHGIHNSLSQRYMVSQTDTQCRLMIPSKYNEESIGRWTCVAGLYGLTDEEASATITVRSQSTAIYFITIISIIATLLLILCISSYIYVHRKRRTSTEDSPPCVCNDKSNLAQFFVKFHPVIGNCNKSHKGKILE